MFSSTANLLYVYLLTNLFFSPNIKFSICFSLQQQLHSQGLPHTHPPGVSLPHPSGLPPPHLPPSSSSGLLALSNALSSAQHLPVKDEKDRDRDREREREGLRESPLPPRGPSSLYARNTTDSHSSHGSDDGRGASEDYHNRKMLGYEKRDLSNSQPNLPGLKSSNSGSNPGTHCETFHPVCLHSPTCFLFILREEAFTKLMGRLGSTSVRNLLINTNYRVCTWYQSSIVFLAHFSGSLTISYQIPWL